MSDIYRGLPVLKKLKFQQLLKKIVIFILRYYSPRSQSVANELVTSLSQICPQLPFQPVLKIIHTLASYFSFKDRLPSAVHSNVLYKFS